MPAPLETLKFLKDEASIVITSFELHSDNKIERNTPSSWHDLGLSVFKDETVMAVAGLGDINESSLGDSSLGFEQNGTGSFLGSHGSSFLELTYRIGEGAKVNVLPVRYGDWLSLGFGIA